MGLNGFSGAVNITISGLPAGVTAEPSQFGLVSGNVTQVLLQAAITATPGNASLTVSAVYGSVEHSGQCSLTVTQPPPPVDFSLSIPASVSVEPAASSMIQVGVTPVNGFSALVDITISGLPAGVTATPAQFSIGASDFQQVIISAAITAAAGSTNLQISAVSGALNHSGQIDLTVNALQSPLPSTARIRYDLTDASWDASFLNFGPLPWILYDPGTERFFVSDESLNRIEVFDAASELQIGQIDVPGAFVGDETPDHTTIYMGTQLGDVYAIDPVSMTVITRYPATQIGPAGYPAYIVKVLANGSLVLFGDQGGIPAVDGYQSLAVWNPVNNSFQKFPIPSIEMELTADRTKIVLGAGQMVTLLDPTTGSETSVQVPVDTIVIQSVLVSPDGTDILVPSGSNLVTVYDANTLAQVDQFSVGIPNLFYRCIFSYDGNTLFVMPEGGGTGYAFDWRTHQQTGSFVSFTLDDEPGTMGPTPMAVDETGLIANVIGHGVAFLDGSQLYIQPPAPLGSGEADAVQPTFGPVQGGTQATLVGQATTDVQSVDFGGQQASVLSTGPLGIVVSTPPGSPGPADVTMQAINGDFLLLPRVYSYGPWIVEATPSASTAEGGGTETLYGYGFGSFGEGGPAPGLQVSVGGSPVAVTQYSGAPIPATTPYYPFPIESAQFIIPAGNAGSSVAVTVSNSAGSVTQAGAIQYLPAIQQFPIAGAALAQGIYDSTRDVYYFTDQTQIRVFSKTNGQWLAPIPMPASAQRLWAISLSPDGSNLAASDALAAQIYVLDPDTPSAVSTFPITTTEFDSGEEPCGLAITDSGIVYFATFSPMFTGGWAFHKLDTTTGTETDYHTVQEGDYDGDAVIRVLLSSDNSRVFFNIAGGVFSLDTATDTFFFNPVIQGFDYELTLSSNQTWMSATEYLMDTNLNPLSFVTYVDRDTWSQTAVYGEKISPDGNLLFSPLANALDVIDGKRGVLLTRIALPVGLSENFDALVSDGVDNILVAITGQMGSGIAVIDLTSLPEPLPLPYPEAKSAELPRWDPNSLGGRKGLPQTSPGSAGPRSPSYQDRKIRHLFHAPSAVRAAK